MSLFENIGVGYESQLNEYVDFINLHYRNYIKEPHINKDLTINLKSVRLWAGNGLGEIDDKEIEKIFPKYITFNRIADLDIYNTFIPAYFFNNIKNIRNINLSYCTLDKGIKLPEKMTGTLKLENCHLLDGNLDCCESIKKLDSIIIHNSPLTDVLNIPEKITHSIQIMNVNKTGHIGSKYYNSSLIYNDVRSKIFTIKDLINSRWDWENYDKGIKIDLK